MTNNMSLSMVYLQVDGTGNCLFSLVKKSLSVHTAPSQEATYFPNRYFRRMVVNFMVNHQQLILKNKYLSLMSQYSVQVEGEADQGRGGLHHCHSSNTYACCSGGISGVMR